MAAQATLHCLIGCMIGELIGLEIGRLMGFDTHQTIILAGALSFVSGYAVSTLPLMRNGMRFFESLKLVLAADTLSILTMVIVDNFIIAVAPGAMEKDPLQLSYWGWRAVSLAAAFVVACPVNYYLLTKGKGHALTHQHMHGEYHSHDDHHHDHTHHHSH